MTDYLFGAFGIVVSLLLFFVGYRQTIGSRKERIATTNAELERILVRRIVLEKYLPSEIDISRLIDGKTRDYRVRSAEVHSTTQLLNTVYTRIMESDLIPSDQREEILGRITPVLAQSEAEPVQEEVLEEIALSSRRLRTSRALIGAMALSSSILAGLITIIPEISTTGLGISELLSMTVIPAAVSLALIVTFYTATRLRAGQEDTASRARELSKYISFEDQVRKTLERFGGIKTPLGGDSGFDFLIERGGRSFVIEVKTWSRHIPASIISINARRLKRAAAEVGATEMIIVTSGSTHGVHGTADAEGVKMFTLKELRNYLAHLASD